MLKLDSSMFQGLTCAWTSRLKVLSLATLLILGSANGSEARIEGVEYVTFSVGGVSYDVPLGNETRRQEAYFVKKALGGDEEARWLLLGNNETFVWFIGDDEGVRWLHMNKTDAWVS